MSMKPFDKKDFLPVRDGLEGFEIVHPKRKTRSKGYCLNTFGTGKALFNARVVKDLGGYAVLRFSEKTKQFAITAASENNGDATVVGKNGYFRPSQVFPYLKKVKELDCDRHCYTFVGERKLVNGQFYIFFNLDDPDWIGDVKKNGK